METAFLVWRGINETEILVLAWEDKKTKEASFFDVWKKICEKWKLHFWWWRTAQTK